MKKFGSLEIHLCSALKPDLVVKVGKCLYVSQSLYDLDAKTELPDSLTVLEIPEPDLNLGMMVKNPSFEVDWRRYFSPWKS